MNISLNSPTSVITYGLSPSRTIVPAKRDLQAQGPQDEFHFQFVDNGFESASTGSSTVVAKSAEEKSVASIRPEVQAAIDFVAGADECRVIHTTREFTPQYPDGFAAGRFAVTASKGDQSKTFIMQTESRVGHLGKVVPGKTRVDGYIAQVSDPYAQVKEGSQLTEPELKAFTLAMLADRPHDPVTEVVAAIYSNGDQVKYASAVIEGTKLPAVG